MTVAGTTGCTQCRTGPHAGLELLAELGVVLEATARQEHRTRADADGVATLPGLDADDALAVGDEPFHRRATHELPALLLNRQQQASDEGTTAREEITGRHAEALRLERLAQVTPQLTELGRRERRHVDGPAFRDCTLVGVVVGKRSPFEDEAVLLAQIGDQLWSGRQESVTQRTIRSLADRGSQVLLGLLAAVVDACLDLDRVAGIPDAATGVRAGAAEQLGLLDDDRRQAGIACGQRANQCARSRSDDQEVALDVPSLRHAALPDQSRVRNSMTKRSNSYLRSTCAQWPQLENTWSSALGIRRNGIRPPSKSTIRSSRPQIVSVR